MTTPIKENPRSVAEAEKGRADDHAGAVSDANSSTALYAPATEITLLSGLLADANSSTALHSPATEEPFSVSYLLQKQDGVLALHATVAG